jgi:hypothetical protein
MVVGDGVRSAERLFSRKIISAFHLHGRWQHIASGLVLFKEMFAMTQNEINREVARVTGESVECIRHLGFGLVIVPHAKHPPRNPSGDNQTVRTCPVKPIHRPLQRAYAAA